MTTTSQLTLPPTPASVSVARRFVVDVLLELDAEGACDDAATLVSELATNAILHARTAFTVEVSVEGPAVRIGVADHSVAVARVRDYGPGATTGRGMRLVATMSSRWGVETVEGGKTVWFELPPDGSQEALSWDDESDVDALLAAFPDEQTPLPSQGPAVLLRWVA